ncbi:4-hydroxy-tetrahydrodipicolinate synthase [Georgenia sp. SUBG003]|uniref:4-hydroxy-tetrahydrodipicolinate synthase n=1 Tax=Georgenia sp. SUBG003 TaxID=1497974 RepID=UPI003AB123A0
MNAKDTMFDKNRYGKILVPVLTPFGDDQELDLEKLTSLIDYLIENNKADTLILSGTTGEFHTQTFDERVAVFEAGVEAAAGRLPVVAGIGCTSTKETIALGRKAVDLGIETLMVVSPYYTKPSQTELLAHYEAVAGELGNANIMLYNIPIFTGVNLSPEIVGQLAQIENVVAIKDEAELNPKQITQYLNVTPEDFILYNGDDTMILETYAQAGERVGGVVSGASHLLGDFIRTMIETFQAGDVVEAGRMQAKLYPVLKIMGQGGRTNPAPLWKDAMRIAGVDAGSPRLPLTSASPEERENIRRELERFGALELAAAK